MTKRLNFFHRLLLATFCITALLGGPATWAHDSGHKDFYYYNPDSLQSNLARLTAMMDGLLAESNLPIKFQAFSHFLDFEETIKQHQPVFLIAPEWYVRRYGQQLKIVPLLVPVRENSSHYTKLLLLRRDASINFANLKAHSLAMTTMGHDNENQLNNILFRQQGYDANHLNIVTVPKDSDALFALTLGQVDMALVTGQNVDFLKRMNSTIFKQLKIVAQSHPLPLPNLCYIKGKAQADDIQQLKILFLENNKRKKLLQTLELLQIDEWKTP